MKVVLLFLIVFGSCNSRGSVKFNKENNTTKIISYSIDREPPGPWEQHSAILTADLVAEVEISAQNVSEKNLILEGSVVEVYITLLSSEIKKQQEIQIVLATPLVKDFEMIRASLESDQNKCIVALNYDNGKFIASSHWVECTFLKPSDDNRQSVREILHRSQFSKTDALKKAKEILGQSTNGYIVDVIGGKIEGGKFVQIFDSKKSAYKLVWRIMEMKNTSNYLLIDMKNGESLNFLIK